MAALRAKGRIRLKLRSIQEEKEFIIHSLEIMIEKATKSANGLLQEESAHLLSKYHDVNQELENCLEKLIFIQAAIDGDVSSVEEDHKEHFPLDTGTDVFKKYSRDSSYSSAKQRIDKMTSNEEVTHQGSYEQNEQVAFSDSTVNENTEHLFMESIADIKISELVNTSSEILHSLTSETTLETDILAHSTPSICTNNLDNAVHSGSCLQSNLVQKEDKSHQTEEIPTLISASCESQESFYHSLSSYSGECATNKTSSLNLNDFQSSEEGDETNVEIEAKMLCNSTSCQLVTSVNDRISSTIINVAAETMGNDSFPKDLKIHSVFLENEYKFISGKHEAIPNDFTSIHEEELKTFEFPYLTTNKFDVPDKTNGNKHSNNLIGINEHRVHQSENALNFIPEAIIVTDNIIYGTVSEVVNPSDFWLKLYSSTEEHDLLESIQANIPSQSKSLAFMNGMCYLAPLDQNKGYCRAQIVNVFSSLDPIEVEILYVDFGFSTKINVSKLHPLPVSLSTIPAQAIHCTLSKVFPIEEVWSEEAVQKFKELTEWYQVEAYVHSKDSNGIYCVSLVVKISIEDENLEYDVGQMLCLEKFASNTTLEDRVMCSTEDNDYSCFKLPDLETVSEEIFMNDSLISKKSNIALEENETTVYEYAENYQDFHNNKLHAKEVCLLNCKDSIKTSHSQYISPDNYINKHAENSQNVINLELSNAKTECYIPGNLNSDPMNITSSGKQLNLVDLKISQSSEVRPNSNKVQKLNLDLNCSMQDISKNDNIDSLLVEDNRETLETCSIHKGNEFNNSFKFSSESTENLSEDRFDWEAIIPPLHITLMENKYLFVMVAAVCSPGEFYVNVAVENSVDLDELQEQMNNFYGSLNAEYKFQEVNLHENQFCCCQFSDDNCWYRAKIINMCSVANKELHENQLKNEILVQYVDYGNKEFVTIENLRPLTARFAKYPAYALCCTLAGVKPKSDHLLAKNKNGDEIYTDAEIEWGLTATENLKMLTNFEKCLTAQVLNSQNEKSVPLEVFLWDTHHSADILINAVLVEQGVVAPISQEMFNGICIPFHGNVKVSEYSEELDEWNPMAADFWSAQNSYGVDLSDPEVAITGYRSTDEKYICKFYDQYGRCHRGEYCPYKHMPCGKEGATRDKKDTYVWGPTLNLPDVSSYVLVQVSAVFDPGHFYIIFPYGCVPVQNIKIPDLKDIYQELPEEDEQLDILVEAMSDHYSHTHFEESTTIAPALGNIVAAKYEIDGQWYRSRIIEVEDVAKPAEVFFVDFGNCEWISRQNIREIKQEFLYLPFQAVECFLAHIEPKNFHKGNTWSKDSRKMFKELVEGKTLLAHIVQKIDSVLYLELQTLSVDFNCIINLSLVANGFAQYIQLHGSSKISKLAKHNDGKASEKILYIPG